MTSAAPEMIGRQDVDMRGAHRPACRAPRRGGRELNFLEIHRGTHARRGMKAGGTFCATPSLDRHIAGAWRHRLAGGLQFCAQVVSPWVPLLTDSARQFGRGCVCACPYQGASCGCRLRSGATHSLRPANLPPAGATRPPSHTPQGPVVRRACCLFPKETPGRRANLNALTTLPVGANWATNALHHIRKARGR